MIDERELQRLLAPYQLRDGHDPSAPFSPREPIGRGWYGLIKELVEDLLELAWNREVLQVKEKFGTLRFYVTDRDPLITGRTIAARERSAETCETCGRAGSLRIDDRGWHCTRCRGCWESQQKEQDACPGSR